MSRMSTSSTHANTVERKRDGLPGIEAEHCHGSEHKQRQKARPCKSIWRCVKSIWRCVQPDSQALDLRTPFNACTKCKEGKEYNKASNAAAHFKRCHLHPATDSVGVKALKDLGYLAQFEVPDTDYQNTGTGNLRGPMEESKGYDMYASQPQKNLCDMYFGGVHNIASVDDATLFATLTEAKYPVPSYSLTSRFDIWAPQSPKSPIESHSFSSFASSFDSQSSSLSSGSLSCLSSSGAMTRTSSDNDATRSPPYPYLAEQLSSRTTVQRPESAISKTDVTVVASLHLDLTESVHNKLRSLSAPPDPANQHEVMTESQHGVDGDYPAAQEMDDLDPTLVSEDSNPSTTNGIETQAVHETPSPNRDSDLRLMSGDIATTHGGSSCITDTQEDHTSTTSSPYPADQPTHHMITQRSGNATTPEDSKSQIPLDSAEDSAYPADSPHYSFETLSATPESASQQNAQRNPIAHRLQQLRAEYEALDEIDDYGCSSDSNTDADSDSNDGVHEISGTSQRTESRTDHQNEGGAPDSASPGYSGSNDSVVVSFSGSTRSHTSNDSQHHQVEANGTSADHNDVKTNQAVARPHRDKDHAEVLPCPLGSVINCTGTDKDMATLERILCTTNHGVLYHHKCKRRLDDPAVTRTNDAKTLRARRKENQEIWRAHEQEGCEEYFVVLECPTAPVVPSEDPRHKRAPNCVTSRRRKQAEYNYLCTWLLEVPARGIEVGEETKHKEQRKSPGSKKNDIALESLKIGEAQVKIINELLDIIQHAREETADMTITSALRRRLQRAPQLLTESSCHHYQSTPGVIPRHTVPPTPDSTSNQSFALGPSQTASEMVQPVSRSMHYSSQSPSSQPPAKRRRVDSTTGPSRGVRPRGKLASIAEADLGASDVPQTPLYGQQQQALQTQRHRPTLTTNSGVIPDGYGLRPSGVPSGDILTDITDGMSCQQSNAMDYGHGYDFGVPMPQWDEVFPYSQPQHDDISNLPPVWHAKHQYLDTPNHVQVNSNSHLPLNTSLDSDLGSASLGWLGYSFTSSGQATQDYMSND